MMMMGNNGIVFNIVRMNGEWGSWKGPNKSALSSLDLPMQTFETEKGEKGPATAILPASAEQLSPEMRHGIQSILLKLLPAGSRGCLIKIRGPRTELRPSFLPQREKVARHKFAKRRRRPHAVIPHRHSRRVLNFPSSFSLRSLEW